MTFTAVSQAADANLGKYLKIVSANGVYGQLSENSAVWSKMIKRKKGVAEGREYRYLLRTAYGSAAAQFIGVSGSSVAYPTSHQGTIQEATANYKDFALTIEVERVLIQRAMSDLARYGEPLAEEIKSKTIAMARMLSAACFQDGSGRIGTVSSAAVTNTTQLSVVLKTGSDDVGHIGWFEVGDKIKCVSTAGAAQVPTLASGTHSYFVVASVDRTNDTIVLNSYDSSDALLDIDAANQVGAGDYFIRYGITANDYASQSTNDWNNICEAFVGLDSLTEDDGRKVFGITMNGVVKGTRHSGSGNPVDSQLFQELLSKVKVAVGEGRYKWSSAIMAPEVMDALVESRETDRRFTTLSDNTRGVNGLGYQHGKDRILFESDEFVPKKRIYVIPDADILEFRGSDFDWVKDDKFGKQFYLKPGSGTHYRTVRAYMEGSGLILCRHPQAIGVLENFTF